jgi:hypothetical protein
MFFGPGTFGEVTFGDAGPATVQALQAQATTALSGRNSAAARAVLSTTGLLASQTYATTPKLVAILLGRLGVVVSAVLVPRGLLSIGARGIAALRSIVNLAPLVRLRSLGALAATAYATSAAGLVLAARCNAVLAGTTGGRAKVKLTGSASAVMSAASSVRGTLILFGRGAAVLFGPSSYLRAIASLTARLAAATSGYVTPRWSALLGSRGALAHLARGTAFGRLNLAGRVASAISLVATPGGRLRLQTVTGLAWSGTLSLTGIVSLLGRALGAGAGRSVSAPLLNLSAAALTGWSAASPSRFAIGLVGRGATACFGAATNVAARLLLVGRITASTVGIAGASGTVSLIGTALAALSATPVVRLTIQLSGRTAAAWSSIAAAVSATLPLVTASIANVSGFTAAAQGRLTLRALAVAAVSAATLSAGFTVTLSGRTVAAVSGTIAGFRYTAHLTGRAVVASLAGATAHGRLRLIGTARIVFGAATTWPSSAVAAVVTMFGRSVAALAGTKAPLRGVAQLSTSAVTAWTGAKASVRTRAILVGSGQVALAAIAAVSGRLRLAGSARAALSATSTHRLTVALLGRGTAALSRATSKLGVALGLFGSTVAASLGGVAPRWSARLRGRGFVAQLAQGGALGRIGLAARLALRVASLVRPRGRVALTAAIAIVTITTAPLHLAARVFGRAAARIVAAASPAWSLILSGRGRLRIVAMTQPHGRVALAAALQLAGHGVATLCTPILVTLGKIVAMGRIPLLRLFEIFFANPDWITTPAKRSAICAAAPRVALTVPSPRSRVTLAPLDAAPSSGPLSQLVKFLVAVPSWLTTPSQQITVSMPAPRVMATVPQSRHTVTLAPL